MADVELIELLRDRFRPKKSKHETEQRRVAVAAELRDLLTEQLTDPDATLTIEVPPNLLAEMIEARENETLSSQYNIVQISETLFEISMKALDLD